MSTPMKIHNDKENYPLGEVRPENSTFDQSFVKKLQADFHRLEKLYAEQTVRAQTAQQDHERLELELLNKEKQILQLQLNSKKFAELNKSLSKKLSTEVGYYESELSNYKRLEKEWQLKLNKYKMDKIKYDQLLKAKNDEISQLNNEVESVLNELDSKKSEIDSMLKEIEGIRSQLIDLNPDETNIAIESQMIPEDEDSEFEGDISTNQDILQDDSDLEEISQILGADISVASASLADELNNKLDEKDKQLRKSQFEIISLKKEKDQLYSYINKLLKNRPNANQNEILKEKLVKRRILRAVSSNYDATRPLKKTSRSTNSKRAISNFVNLKSYNYEKIRDSTIFKNSDYENSEEEEDDILELERHLLGLNFMFGISPLISHLKNLKPTGILMPNTSQEAQDIDLSVD